MLGTQGCVDQPQQPWRPGKVLTVFVHGDVIVEDRGLLLGVAPRGPPRFVDALWEREEYFGALSAGLAQSQPPPHQG